MLSAECFAHLGGAVSLPSQTVATRTEHRFVVSRHRTRIRERYPGCTRRAACIGSARSWSRARGPDTACRLGRLCPLDGPSGTPPTSWPDGDSFRSYRAHQGDVSREPPTDSAAPPSHL